MINKNEFMHNIGGNDHSLEVAGAHCPGVSLFANATETRLELVATREVRYSTLHPDNYVLDPGNHTIRDALRGKPTLTVVDRECDRFYGSDLRTYMKNETNQRGYIVIEGSESAKGWDAVQYICREAIMLELPRDGVVMAVGGGVALDIAGFAASIFRRGVSFVRIPTSLIGIVDVGVGIKQGINAHDRKNILGAFYPATLNINDLTFLATLTQRHLSCGLAEIIKMAIMCDPQLFAVLEEVAGQLIASKFQNSATARDIIIRAEYLMMQQLQPNLFESEARRVADFGHTFSPVIESASRWAINHGEAVALDMLISTGIAVVKGLCSRATLQRLHSLLLAAKLPVRHPLCEPRLLMQAIDSARTHRSGRLNLVVPREIGKAEFVEQVTAGEIEAALSSFEMETSDNGSSSRGHRRNTSANRVVA